MRKGWLVIGVVLGVVGAVLLVVPAFPSNASFRAFAPGECVDCQPVYNVYHSGFSLPGGTNARFSWSSPSTVTFVAVTCSRSVSPNELDSAHGSEQQARDCGTNRTVADVVGTSGSYSFTIPAGGSLVFYAVSSSTTPPTVTTTLTSALPLLGLVLIGLGAVCGGLAVLVRPRAPEEVPPSAPPAPEPPPGSAPSPDSGGPGVG